MYPYFRQPPYIPQEYLICLDSVGKHKSVFIERIVNVVIIEHIEGRIQASATISKFNYSN